MFKNFTQLNEFLKHIPWNRAFLEEDMDICTERVNDLLPDAAMCIPAFTDKKKIYPPWIINKIKKKERLWRKLVAELVLLSSVVMLLKTPIMAKLNTAQKLSQTECFSDPCN